jgi:hypothetical protein
MTITRAILKDKKIPAKDRAYYKDVLKGYEECDKFAVKALKPLGILLTSHPGNRPFLKASVESHKKLGYWLAVVYDNYWNPIHKGASYDGLMPKREVFDEIDTFIISRYQTWGGVLYPYFWCLKFGLQTMGGFEYVYCANGDCILEKPENFDQLLDMMGDADIFGVGWEKNNKRPLFNTTGFIARTTAINAMMKHFQDHLIPLDNYEKYAQEMGNTEARFARAIKDLDLKCVKPKENPFNTQVWKPGVGTWYKTVGFRHIHGEYNYQTRYGKKENIPWNYIDETYFNIKRKK